MPVRAGFAAHNTHMSRIHLLKAAQQHAHHMHAQIAAICCGQRLCQQPLAAALLTQFIQRGERDVQGGGVPGGAESWRARCLDRRAPWRLRGAQSAASCGPLVLARERRYAYGGPNGNGGYSGYARYAGYAGEGGGVVADCLGTPGPRPPPEY